jgi:hypothetical protein
MGERLAQSPAAHRLACPAGCGRNRRTNVELLCRPCWYRVPPDLRAEVWRAWRRFQAAEITPDELTAVQDRAIAAAGRKRAKPSPEQMAEIAAGVQDLADMVAGKGRHADHQREQIGRCLYCSCGLRVQR